MESSAAQSRKGGVGGSSHGTMNHTFHIKSQKVSAKKN